MNLPGHLQVFGDLRLPVFRHVASGIFQQEIDFRVSILPTLFGEKAVLRVLDKSNLQIGLERLGFLPRNLAIFQEAIKKPYGMILVTGPTGSGKSTTLASIVDVANRNRKDHIITVEDPIEFVYQSQGCIVNHREIGIHTHSFFNSVTGCSTRGSGYHSGR